MESLVYYNGVVGSPDDVTIPFNDRSIFFGDGIYEVAIARNHRIYALDEHIERLYKNAKVLDINVSLLPSEMSQMLSELVKEVESKNQIVYWQISRGSGERERLYTDDMSANILIYLRQGNIRDISLPVSAILASDTRHYHCNLKTLNQLPSVIYAKNASKAGAYETVLFRNQNRVTECSHSNVHIITPDNVFKTAPTDELILPGIARAHLIKACSSVGIKVEEAPFSVDELMNAKEVFFSSTTAPIIRCRSIDGKCVGGNANDIFDKLYNTILDDIISSTG